tara:strand:- start:4747 stop:5667 length:921 start_codon:yes stop_codon:yes gene_type:complete
MSTHPQPDPGDWAIAIHGGAGAIPRDLPEERKEACLAALRRILASGRRLLADGAAALDVVEAVARLLEDEPMFNAGRGAVFTRDGRHELEASIMDGVTGRCGSVSNLETVRNPVSLARLLMDRTPHVMIAGAGAERFADDMGVERVHNEWFDTPHRREEFERVGGFDPVLQEGSTIGVVARDEAGGLAAATSTGGMNGKMPGRVGDTPIHGAGNWADDGCAVSCTGHGEEFVRHAAALRIATGLGTAGTLSESIHDVLSGMPAEVGGVIAVGTEGPPVLSFTSQGMYRGCADASGRSTVAIWEDMT